MDPIGRIIDVLPPRLFPRRAEGGSTAGVTTVVSVIEPDPNQLIGALMLRRSLARSPTVSTYRLCIVERDSGVPELLEACAALGVEAAAAPHRFDNPFLNKWLMFDAFEGLRDEAHLALLDWDLLLCAARPLPGPFGPAVGARRNRSSMYRDLVGGAGKPLPRTPAVLWGRVRTSVNGGVLIGSGASLQRCAEGTIAWVGEIAERAPEAATWKVEQLALSIAVGEVGLVPLDLSWNVTPQPRGPVADGDVGLWHYNNGVDASRLLKRCLSEPARAQAQLARLAERWPTAIALFSELYAEVLAQDAVARLLRRAA